MILIGVLLEVGTCTWIVLCGNAMHWGSERNYGNAIVNSGDETGNTQGFKKLDAKEREREKTESQ